MDIRSKKRKRIIAIGTLTLLGFWYALTPPSNRAIAHDPAPTAAPQPTKKDAQAVVRHKNKNAVKHRQKFEREGWTFVEADEPNEQVTSLDAQALGRFEQEIQVQLQTNTYHGAMLERVREIARVTNEQKTRYVALETLGRSDDRRAQELLVESFEEFNGTAERGQILGMLKPQTMSDRVTGLLLSNLTRNDLSDSLKKQSLGALVAASLAQNLSPNEVSLQIPQAWRATYQRMMTSATSVSNHSH